MLLRNGKSLEPPRKRLKANKQRLYINDINTFETELFTMLKYRSYRNAEPTLRQIIAERAKGPFVSRQDLMKRVSALSKDSIRDDIKLIFETRYDEQEANIYKTLMKVKSLKDQSSDTIKCISEFATGGILTCDNPSCEEEIFVLNEFGVCTHIRYNMFFKMIHDK